MSWRAAQERKESEVCVGRAGNRKGKAECSDHMRLPYIMIRRQRKQLCQCTNRAMLPVTGSIGGTAVVAGNFLDPEGSTHFCQRAVL